MKSLLVILSLVLAGAAHAEEKNLNVCGMHCEACADMVKDKVCNDQYAVCDITPPAEEKTAKAKKGKKEEAKLGKLHLKTKDGAAKIDEKAINTALADTEYTVTQATKCPAKKAM